MGKEAVNETTLEKTSELSLNEKQREENAVGPAGHDIPAFGYDLIREFLLNELLGKEASQLLYWGGKQLARKFPLQSVEEIIEFFRNAGWGTLTQTKLSKDESLFELSGSTVERRLSINVKCHFQLEAGFLAEQFEIQRKVSTEAIEEPKKRGAKVSFIVKWDTKDGI
ncbi:YslB family protein [Peribacillus sp. SCS-37]|uniref:YslB family protein n=1 Tax=Paraperibacillus esterisolvens TaxID=3115296 RepID=UPI0039065A9B